MTSPTPMWTGAAPWLLADAVLLGTAAVAVGRWAREDGRRARGLAVAAGVGAAWTAALAAIGPGGLAVSAITFLQEGTTADTARAVAQVGDHAGPHATDLLWPALAGGRGAREAALLNLWLAPFVAAGVGVAAWRVAGPLAAVTLGAVALANPVARHAAAGIEPASLAAALGLLGLLPWAMWRDPGAPRPTRALGAAGVVAAAVAVAGVRVELAGPLLAGLAAGVLADIAPGGGTRVDRAVRAVLARPAVAASLTAALAAAAAFAWTRPGHGPFHPWPSPPEVGRLTWGLTALHPLHASAIQLPWALAAWLPVGVVALVVAGVACGLRHPLRTAAIPLAAFLLFRTYTAAAHDALYEVLRYLTGLMPWLLVTAAVGWRVVAPHLGRAVPLLALACLLAPLPRVGAQAFGWPDEPDPLDGNRLLSRDLQQEARLLLAQRDAEPACAVVLRTRRWGGAGEVRGADAEWPVVLGPGVARWVRPDEPADVLVVGLPPDTLRDGDRSLAGVLRRAPCLRYHRGLDCHTTPDPCAPDLVGARLLREVTGPAAPYTHPVHALPVDGPLRLQTWDLDGSALLDRLGVATAP